MPTVISTYTAQRIIDAMVTKDQSLLRALAREGVTREAMADHARDLGLTDRFVKACRLSGSRPAIRQCVNCDARFLSSGVHNRLCRRCPAR